MPCSQSERLVKIAFCVRYFPVYGGAETVTICLANELCRRGYEVHVFYLWDTSDSDEIDPDVILHKVTFDSKPDGFAINSIELPQIEDELARYLHDTRIDIVINQCLPPKLVGRAATSSCIIGCRHHAIYMNSPRQSFVERHFGKRALTAIMRWKLRSFIGDSDYCVVLCDQYASQLKRMYANKSRFTDKVRVINNPYRFKRFAYDEYANKRPLLLSMGRLDRFKRVDVLIRAWKLIEEEALQSNWWFYVVGEGDSRKDLISLAKSLDCENVRFLDYCDPRDLYKGAKMLVSASSGEGYPMTIIEACSNACVPIVANTYSAAEDAVLDGITGYLLDDASPEGFAKALKSLMLDEKLLTRMAEAAYSYSERYDIAAVTNKWEALFSEALDCTDDVDLNVVSRQ